MGIILKDYENKIIVRASAEYIKKCQSSATKLAQTKTVTRIYLIKLAIANAKVAGSTGLVTCL